MNHRKSWLITILISVIGATLFYFSDISFQLEYISWKPWLKNVAFFLFISIITHRVVLGNATRWKEHFERKNGK